VKYASLKVLVLVLATGGLIAACASGNDTVDFGTGGSSPSTSSDPPDTTSAGGGFGGSGGEAPTTSGVTTTTGSGDPDGGGVCVPKCNIDSDCQNSCPVAQTGINCCDAPSGFCYVASTSICPAPKPDGGTMNPPY
jgi:hypothetical protein